MDRTRAIVGAVLLVLAGALLRQLAGEWPRALAAAVALCAVVWTVLWLIARHAERQALPQMSVLDRPPREPSEKPNIVLERIVVEERPLFELNGTAPVAQLHCGVLMLRNAAVGGHPDAEVPHVLAEIKFMHRGQLVAKASPGRWGDTDQPSLRHLERPFGSLIDLNTVPFRIGERHELDLVIKHASDGECYAFSNSSYSAPDWRVPAFRLDQSRYEVTVTLVGRRVDQEFHFELHNQGAGQGFTLTELPRATQHTGILAE